MRKHQLSKPIGLIRAILLHFDMVNIIFKSNLDIKRYDKHKTNLEEELGSGTVLVSGKTYLPLCSPYGHTLASISVPTQVLILDIVLLSQLVHICINFLHTREWIILGSRLFILNIFDFQEGFKTLRKQG